MLHHLTRCKNSILTPRARNFYHFGMKRKTLLRCHVIIFEIYSYPKSVLQSPLNLKRDEPSISLNEFKMNLAFETQ